MQTIVLAPVDTGSFSQMLDLLADTKKYKKKLEEFSAAQEAAVNARDEAHGRIADARSAEESARGAQENAKSAMKELAEQASKIAALQEDILVREHQLEEKKRMHEEREVQLSQHEQRLVARQIMLDTDAKAHEEKVGKWKIERQQAQDALKRDKDTLSQDRAVMDKRIAQLALAKKMIEENQ
jgi:hypothetical protein